MADVNLYNNGKHAGSVILDPAAETRTWRLTVTSETHDVASVWVTSDQLAAIANACVTELAEIG
jgi:hypothetical protein